MLTTEQKRRYPFEWKGLGKSMHGYLADTGYLVISPMTSTTLPTTVSLWIVPGTYE